MAPLRGVARTWVRVAFLAMGVLALGACGADGLSADDRRLLDYATRSYDRRAMMNKKVSLGAHNGTPVVVEFPCSDVCPNYTIRIIHYSLTEGQSCAEAGGVEKTIMVPLGIGRTERSYCFPAILAANWHKYRM